MADQIHKIEDALETIEGSILPGLSHLLDDLLDSAALARPGVDAEVHAHGLRDTASRITGLIELIAAVAEIAQAPSVPAASRRVSA